LHITTILTTKFETDMSIQARDNELSIIYGSCSSDQSKWHFKTITKVSYQVGLKMHITPFLTDFEGMKALVLVKFGKDIE